MGRDATRAARAVALLYRRGEGSGRGGCSGGAVASGESGIHGHEFGQYMSFRALALKASSQANSSGIGFVTCACLRVFLCSCVLVF